MQNKLKQIRSQLRLSMNGIVSTSMREKGSSYKLNFGVSIPKIKEIASIYQKDANLAETLWQENVREMKIMATLLQPIESFTQTNAEHWAGIITQPEIAEQYTFNLLQYLPYAEDLAAKWILREEEYLSLMGYLLYAHLFMKGIKLDDTNASSLLLQAKKLLDGKSTFVQRAALTALKRYGRQSAVNAADVLSTLAEYSTSDSAEKQEFYEDIKFELDYYE